MAHGNSSIHKCDDCKVYGMMPRFGSYDMKYLCDCKKETKPSSKEEGNQIGYKWIGWFGSN